MSSRAVFNLQVFACFCFAAAICIRSLRSVSAPPLGHPPNQTLAQRAGLLCILALTCAAYAPSLRDPLLSDDYILIHASANPGALFKTFTRPAGDGAMRPVGELVFGTFKKWAAEDPLKWHALGLALHLVNTGLLYWLCRRLNFSGYATLLACVLFSLHPAHVEAVAWASSTFDLLAALFCLLTLIALTFESGWALVAAPVLTALAILSKESAYVLPVLAFLVVRPRRAKQAPLIGSAFVALALFIHRWHVFAGPGGYVDSATGHAQILSVRPLFVLKALLYRPWWTLLTPIDWAVPPGILLLILLCLMYLTLGVSAAVFLSARRAHLLRMAAILVALLPPIHLALIGSDLQGTRVFYLPTIFFCIWLAQIPRHWGFAAMAALFSFCALRHNLVIRSEVAQVARQACASGARAAIQSGGQIVVRGLPRSLDGVFFFANGYQQCVRSASGNPNATVSTDEGSPALRWDPRLRLLSDDRDVRR